MKHVLNESHLFGSFVGTFWEKVCEVKSLKICNWKGCVVPENIHTILVEKCFGLESYTPTGWKPIARNNCQTVVFPSTFSFPRGSFRYKDTDGFWVFGGTEGSMTFKGVIGHTRIYRRHLLFPDQVKKSLTKQMECSIHFFACHHLCFLRLKKLNFVCYI